MFSGILQPLEWIVETVQDFIQIIYNWLSSTFLFLDILSDVITIPFEIISFVPSFIGVSVIIVSIVGIVKTMLYGGI